MEAYWNILVLCSCGHMISAVDTFSWWSAWLIGGNVTYYKWPTQEGTSIRQHFSKDYTDCVYYLKFATFLIRRYLMIIKLHFP
jgi:hypothetical protein